MASNLAAGSKFERLLAGILSSDGFWVLRIPQNAGGQQPADLIAIKGRYHALIDCKVVSGDRFNLDRIEDNQYNAMTKFRDIGGEVGWFAILMPDGSIHMLDLDTVNAMDGQRKRSLNLRELYDLMTLLDWRERVNDLCE